MSIRVEILYSEGCVHTPATIDLINEASKSLELAIELETIQIDDAKHANTRAFRGSPTILVNGTDIDPLGSDINIGGLT